MRRIQSPQASPPRVVTIAMARAIAILAQNSWGERSTCVNTLRTQSVVDGTKKGKSVVAKNRFREASDMRNSAKGHCAAMNMVRNNAPSMAACGHLLQAEIRDRSRSIAHAGAISNRGK